MTYTIRRAVREDAAELARLLTALGHPTSSDSIEEKWARWEGEDNAALVVQRGDRTLAGCLTLHHMLVLHRTKPVGRISSLIVDERERGTGLGRGLVAEAENLFAQWGCGLIEVTSNMRRQDAHAFYETLGYEKTSFRFAKPDH